MVNTGLYFHNRSVIYTSRQRYTKLYLAYNFNIEIAYCNNVFGVSDIVPRQLYLSHIKKLLQNVRTYKNSTILEK